AGLARALAAQQAAQADVATLRAGGKAAQLAEINDKIASAQASEEVALRVYQADQRLLEKQAATKLQVLRDKDTLERAKLQVQQLEDQKRTLVTSSDQAVAQAKLRDAQAALASAQHQVALGAITSPIPGT